MMTKDFTFVEIAAIIEIVIFCDLDYFIILIPPMKWKPFFNSKAFSGAEIIHVPFIFFTHTDPSLKPSSSISF